MTFTKGQTVRGKVVGFRFGLAFASLLDELEA
jgi:hypothetical protein